jgi:Hemerythrin HHE cation binding domain
MTENKQRLPGSDAARHGAGDADLAIMLAAHDALRRDLVSLAQAASFADLPDPGRRRSVAAGWETFKRQLHAHHTAEDELIWPALRERLAHSGHALSVLDEMEAEHALVDPLLAAVDAAFASTSGAGGHGAGAPSPGDAVDALVGTLSGHLTHEERDALPLIGVALTAGEWRGVGVRIARSNGLSTGAEMFPWMLDGAPEESVRSTLGQLPPPVRIIYRRVWKPKYARTSRW